MTKSLDESEWPDVLAPIRKQIQDHDFNAAPRENLRCVASIITAACEAVRLPVPVVVGGFAVELYTKGGYTTHDLDMITDLRPSVHAIMLELGFEFMIGHGYYTFPGLKQVVEFPEPPLAGNRVKRMNFKDGTHILILSVEDMVVGRMEEFQWWYQCRTTAPCLQQLESMFTLYTESLDYDYIQQQAEELEVTQAWNYCKQAFALPT